MVKEIAQLAIGPGRLSPHEYMLYKLYDPGMAFARKAEYLGKRVQTAMHLPCNDRPWFAVAHDKLLFYATMAGEGLPVPSLLAASIPAADQGKQQRFARLRLSAILFAP